MIDRVAMLHRQRDAYQRLLADASATVVRYYMGEIRKIDADIAKVEMEEKAAAVRTPNVANPEQA